MKKLVIVVLSLIFCTSVFADGTLRMRISGPIKDNRYFLCVSGVGCVSILNGNKGHAYPIDAGEISNIYTVNAINMTRRIQPLPSSCNVTVNDNQTVTVTGTLVQVSNMNYAISNMHCKVS